MEQLERRILNTQLAQTANTQLALLNTQLALYAKPLDLIKTRRCFVDMGPHGSAPTPQHLAAKKRCYRLLSACDCLQAVRTADSDRYQLLAKTAHTTSAAGFAKKQSVRAHKTQLRDRKNAS